MEGVINTQAQYFLNTRSSNIIASITRRSFGEAIELSAGRFYVSLVFYEHNTVAKGPQVIYWELRISCVRSEIATHFESGTRYIVGYG